jgi:Uma2 family endonuclease
VSTKKIHVERAIDKPVVLSSVLVAADWLSTARYTIGMSTTVTRSPVRVIDPNQPRLLTVEEWIQHPDADQYELIDGVLRTRMVNINRHEFSVVRLGRILDEHLERFRIPGGVFGSNTKYRVRGRRGIMPDLSVVLGEKLKQINPDAAYNTIGPDLAVEVLSREQGADYIEERLDDFAKLGTGEVWIVDPWARTVTGWSLQDREYKSFAQVQGEEEFPSQLLAGLRFSIGRLWMAPP